MAGITPNTARILVFVFTNGTARLCANWVVFGQTLLHSIFKGLSHNAGQTVRESFSDSRDADKSPGPAGPPSLTKEGMGLVDSWTVSGRPVCDPYGFRYSKYRVS